MAVEEQGQTRAAEPLYPVESVANRKHQLGDAARIGVVEQGARGRDDGVYRGAALGLLVRPRQPEQHPVHRLGSTAEIDEDLVATGELREDIPGRLDNALACRALPDDPVDILRRSAHFQQR